MEKVEKKDVAAEPVPISEPMPEDMADMDSATGTPVIMPIDEEPLPPASVVERLISTNATLLLELVEVRAVLGGRRVGQSAGGKVRLTEADRRVHRMRPVDRADRARPHAPPL